MCVDNRRALPEARKESLFFSLVGVKTRNAYVFVCNHYTTSRRASADGLHAAKVGCGRRGGATSEATQVVITGTPSRAGL